MHGNTEPSIVTDALILSQARNAFYKKQFYFTLSLFLLSLIMISVLSCIFYTQWVTPSRPIYFAADPLSRLIYDIPVEQPGYTVDEVSSWVTEAITAAYSSNYFNYRTQLQDMEKYFTSYGWRNYMKALVDANNQLGLIQRKLVAIATVTGPPKLIRQGLLAGQYAWKFEVPVLVAYLTPPAYDKTTEFDSRFTVTIIVRREPLLQSYKGLGIVQLIS